MSAYPSNGQGFCLALQAAQTEIVRSCPPAALKRTMTGILNAVIEMTQNGSVNINPIISRDGRVRTAQIVYMQRGAGDVIEGKVDNFCDATKVVQPLEQNIEISRPFKTSFKLQESDIKNICALGDTSQYVMASVMQEINKLAVAVEKALAATLALKAGKFADGSLSKSWVPLTGTPLAPDFIAEAQALDEYRKVEGCGRPVVIGDGKMSIYAQIANIGCCNNQGIDMGQAKNFDYYWSQEVSPAFGAGEHYLMLEPGQVLFLNPLSNIGDFAYIRGNSEAGSIIDQVTGLAINVDKVWSECDKCYIITLSTNWELVVLPDNAFGAADALSGYTGVLHFTNP